MVQIQRFRRACDELSLHLNPIQQRSRGVGLCLIALCRSAEQRARSLPCSSYLSRPRFAIRKFISPMYTRHRAYKTIIREHKWWPRTEQKIVHALWVGVGSDVTKLVRESSRIVASRTTNPAYTDRERVRKRALVFSPNPPFDFEILDPIRFFLLFFFIAIRTNLRRSNNN